MAAKKATPASAGGKYASAAAKKTQQKTVQRAVTAGTSSDPRRLMREAAWARMFGRTEAKNPFGR